MLGRDFLMTTTAKTKTYLLAVNYWMIAMTLKMLPTTVATLGILGQSVRHRAIKLGFLKRKKDKMYFTIEI